MIISEEKPLIKVEPIIDLEDDSKGLYIKAPKHIHEQIVNMLGTNFLEYDILYLTKNK